MNDVTGLSDEGLLLNLINDHAVFNRQRDKADRLSEKADEEDNEIYLKLADEAEDRARELQDRYIAVKSEILRRMTK